jgi:hypothetical protein
VVVRTAEEADLRAPTRRDSKTAGEVMIWAVEGSMVRWWGVGMYRAPWQGGESGAAAGVGLVVEEEQVMVG